MEDFVKSVVKNFSKEYRQQPLPTDLQAEVKARFHKRKSGTPGFVLETAHCKVV